MLLVTENFEPRKRLESDFDGIVRQLFQGVPWSVSCVEKLLPPEVLIVPNDNRVDAWRQTLKTRVSSVLQSERRYEILKRVTAPVANYLNNNGGWSHTGDPYKLAYWFGVELAKELQKISPHDAMVAMVATVELLNLFLKTSKNKPTLDEAMILKIRKSVVDGRWTQDFGEYGIYFTFKALSKVKP
jgi:hypothetical protein